MRKGGIFDMVNLIFGILVAIIGIPMIISPKKITERPNCKIKSEMGIRICGIILVVLGIASIFI